MSNAFLALLGFLVAVLPSCAQPNTPPPKKQPMEDTTVKENPILPATEIATLANGCFWCTEAVFTELNGVIQVTSGYTGGKIKNPTYKEVCSGLTGHAECLQIVFDPAKIQFEELLEVFWETHDPTTLNRQGNDVGTQYRSAIFYHSAEQRDKAQKLKEALDKSGAFDNPIVTEITPFDVFYPAENYHQQYFELNGDSNPYCQLVIRPKLEKFRKVFKDKLKKD
jgi:peptide-methionine (S)-S-oxide reductase